MMNKEQSELSKLIKKGVHQGGFFTRTILTILFIWLPIQVVTIVIVGNAEKMLTLTLSYILISLPLLIPILLEWRTRATRRKLGVSIYKDITEELKQLQVDEEVARDVKAREKFEVKDLDYWFDLKQKGAISEQEYEAKKKELL